MKEDKEHKIASYDLSIPKSEMILEKLKNNINLKNLKLLKY